MHAKLAEIPQPQATQQITPFVLAPHSHAYVPQQQKEQLSVFARVVSALKSSAPSHSSSFTLSPLPAPRTPGQGYITTPTPLLTYHDRTPVWKVGSTYGLLEVDAERERELGVQTSFYIAVALTYLEFLTDREVSMPLLRLAYGADVLRRVISPRSPIETFSQTTWYM